jgi:ribose 5-phosphate isomerase B
MDKAKAILIGADHGGFQLKECLKLYLEKKGFQVKDIGAYSQERCDYPHFAALVAKRISTGAYRRGILICKSGIGNAIVANRFRGVRAALCYNRKAAKLSRQHNDSNVLVLGSLFVNKEAAKRITDVWLTTQFEGGRHKRRLHQIRGIERRIGCER